MPKFNYHQHGSDVVHCGEFADALTCAKALAKALGFKCSEVEEVVKPEGFKLSANVFAVRKSTGLAHCYVVVDLVEELKGYALSYGIVATGVVTEGRNKGKQLTAERQMLPTSPDMSAAVAKLRSYTSRFHGEISVYSRQWFDEKPAEIGENQEWKNGVGHKKGGFLFTYNLATHNYPVCALVLEPYTTPNNGRVKFRLVGYVAGLRMDIPFYTQSEAIAYAGERNWYYTVAEKAL